MVDGLEPFIDLILSAGEDDRIRSQLLKILSLPGNARNTLLDEFIEQMRQQAAPADFIAAIGLLKQDEVASQALAILKK